MKTVVEFIEELVDLGVRVWLEEGKVKVKGPREVLVGPVGDRLKQRKAEVERFLQERAVSRKPAIEPVSRDQDLPLSFAQQRLWFIDRMDPGNPMYNVPYTLPFPGPLDHGALERTLNTLVQRHEVLRTRFEWDGERPLQRIEPFQSFTLPFIDLSGDAPQERRERTERLQRAEESFRFDLERGPLFRFQLVKLTEAEYLLLANMHHIVTDAWSLLQARKEVVQLYAAYAVGAEPALPALKLQYADYAHWQRRHFSGEVLDRELAWWKRRLGTNSDILELPTDHPYPLYRNPGGDFIDRALAPALAQRLDALAKAGRGNPNALFLAALFALLLRLTGQTDLRVGMAASGRNHVGTEDLIGFFVNMLVVNGDLAGDPGFADFFAQVSRHFLDALAHQDLPFERLVEELAPDRDPRYTPLFQVAYSYLESGGRGAEVDDREAEVSQHRKFALTLGVTRHEDTYRVGFGFQNDIFERNTIRRWTGYLVRLLEQAVETPQLPISRLDIIPEEEKRELIDGLYRSVPVPPGWSAPAGFQALAASHPQAMALDDGCTQLDFARFGKRTNQLAHHLRQRGIGPGDFVAVSMTRSIELMVALVAVMKAGGAYLPIDPDYPGERFDFILSDSGARLLLTVGAIAERHDRDLCPTLRLDELTETLAACSDADLPAPDPDGSAYIIYTSGTTGRPKGTLVPHASLANLVFWESSRFGFAPGDRASFLASISFDATISEVWPKFCVGACLVPVSAEYLETPERLRDFMVDRHITICFLPTPLAEILIELDWPSRTRLKWAIVGGDKLHRYPPEGLPFTLVNAYGPTENTCASTYQLALPSTSTAAPPIGVPIDNVRAYVLDAALQLVPPGAIGELCLAGGSLARGYLGRGGLTAERFVPDPFNGHGARLYRSGDLVRLRGGAFDFLGRRDDQVKIRGYRIELGEIETVLDAAAEVALAAVIARRSARGENMLVAFVTAHAHADGTPDELVASLKQQLPRQLPSYMIPANIIPLAAMPLTANGKIDRKALAELALPAEVDAYVAPNGDIEEKLAAIFAEVLQLERVGRNGNFFDLGGHSLVVMRVTGRIQQEFGIELPPRVLFEAPTVAELALQVVGGAGVAAALPPIEPAARDRPLPLSFAQQRLWFIDKLDPGNPMYNIPLALPFQGPLEVTALERALNQVVNRHESLRTHFEWDGEQPWQVVAPFAPFSLPLIDLSGAPPAERQARLDELKAVDAEFRFDLAKGPLVRFQLIKIAGAEYLLLANMHHIVTDAWSMLVARREVDLLYQAFAAGTEPNLPDLPIQYADYAHWQRRHFAGEVLTQELNWWKERLGENSAVLELPTDHPYPLQRNPGGAFVGRTLPAILSQNLEGLAGVTRGNVNALFLSALFVLLHRLTAEPDIRVGMAANGRGHLGTEHLIGFFVNMLVVRCQMRQATRFKALVPRVARDVMDALAHQDLPFERLVEELAPDRDPRYSPLFQVAYIYTEALEAGADAQGLEADSSQHRKFALTFNVTRLAGTYHLGFGFQTDIFEKTTLRRWLGYMEHLLVQVLERPEDAIDRLEILGREEKQQLLDGRLRAVAPQVELPDRTLPAIFRDSVRAHPDAAAIAWGDHNHTFAALDQRAEELAIDLRDHGIGPEVFVAICLSRSADLIVAMLAVFKSGGAAVPIDPAYPADRIDWMLQDCAAPLLLTHSQHAPAMPQTPATILAIDRLDHQPRAARSYIPVAPAHAAYVIYTSGTTGRPKGIVVAHAALANLICWDRRCYAYAPGDRATMVASISFDASVFELWPKLTGGACIYPVPAVTIASPGELRDFLVDNEITVSFWPTQLAEIMFDLSWPKETRLRWVFTGGEKLHRRPPAEAPFVFVNIYGPSENTVATTAHEVRAQAHADAPGIGLPIDNVRAYVVDDRLRLVPEGVVGELCLAASGLARGYLGRGDLTAEKFVPDPFNGSGHRLYRTGDFVRWRTDRAAAGLAYLGRRDGQVKIRGHRVETGEIETILAAADNVSQAAVVVRRNKSGQATLVAYVTAVEPADNASEEWVPALRQYLQRALPAFMVPGRIVPLAAMPLSANGKIDRTALAAIDLSAEDETYAAPANATEERLAAIWCEVLGLERVGRHDNFFALGGHSLLVMRLAARLQKAFAIELPARAFFEAPTIAELALYLARSGHRQVGQTKLVPVSRDQPIRLSFAQQRLWVIDRLQPGLSAYNIPFTHPLTGDLDIAALQRALDEIRRRHEILRTCFPLFEEGPVQQIASFDPIPLEMLDLSFLPAEDRRLQVRGILNDLFQHAFNLETGPLCFFRLLRLAEQEHLLLGNMHHTVSDGMSMTIFAREMDQLYSAFRQGKPSPLPDLPIQYADFSHWQRQTLDEEVLAAQLAYWQEKIGLNPPFLDLPTDRPRERAHTAAADLVYLDLTPEQTASVRNMAKDQGATPFMVILAAFQVLLARYSRHQRILVGTPVAGRHQVETENMIGLFLNTLVLDGDLSGDPAFAAYLAQVRATVLAAFEHQDIPFEKLVERLDQRRDLYRTPLFQVMFNYLEGGETATGAASSAAPVSDDVETQAKFELSLSVVNLAGGFRMEFQYMSGLYDRATILNLAHGLAHLIAAAAADTGRPVSRLDLLSEDGRRILLNAWNETALPLPRLNNVATLFEQRVAADPRAMAVEQGDQQVSYADLNERANRLAAWLVRHGAGPEVPVLLCLDRGPVMAAALLAVLKAGAAYVPLDPAHPAERLALIAADAAAPLLLTAERHLATVAGLAGEVVALEALAGELAALPAHNPVPAAASDHPAYIIFTSGSTGKPKGVVVSHRNLVASQAGYRAWTELSPADRCLQFAAFTFDVSVQEIFATLLCGAVLVFRDEDMYAPAILLARSEAWKLTVLSLPTAVWHELVLELERVGNPDSLPGCLRLVVIAGEAALPERLNQWLALVPPRVTLLNMYGPTEATIYATGGPMRAPEGQGSVARVTIGRPVPFARTYITGDELQLLPAGVPGELILAGAGLARGYLHRPELTAERFVPDPFGSDPGGRLYRSGDLARYLPDEHGQPLAIEFRGRLDFQVKIRGYRVELGEIEAQLTRHPRIAACLATLWPDAAGHLTLIAYATVSDGGTIEQDELKRFLQDKLPAYMVPVSLICVEGLPTTASGKIDRGAPARGLLPAPILGAGVDHVAPRNQREQVLAGIWEDLLGREGIGVNDNFFELGGHSLLATRLVSRLSEAFRKEVPLGLVFRMPTIAALAEELASSQAGPDFEVPQITPVPRDASVLSPTAGQTRLWFLDRLAPGSSAYHIPSRQELPGPLDVAILERALAEIIARHEILRSRYPADEEGQPRLIIAPVTNFSLPYTDLTGLESEERARASWDRYRDLVRQPFDLDAGPTYRFHLLRDEPERYQLLSCLHHIVTDAWTNGILAQELKALYAAFSAGKPSPLRPQRLQFADFAGWQRSALKSEALGRRLTHYKALLVPDPEPIDLPTDRPHPAEPSMAGANLGFTLDENLSAAIVNRAHRANATPFMVLLAAFKVLLARYSGQTSISVGVPIAGRHLKETQDMVGFFVNTLVIRTDLAGDPSFSRFLANVRDIALEAFNYQDVPFEKLVEELVTRRDTKRTPLFQVAFNYLEDETPGEAEAETPAADGGAATFAKFELTLGITHRARRFRVNFEYMTELFERGTIEAMFHHYRILLTAVTQPKLIPEQEGRLSRIPMLRRAERQRILYEWNNTAVVRPAECYLHRLFEARAAANPHDTALIFEDERLSYGELNARANRLAHHLRGLGAGAEVVVGVLLQRSVEMVVSLMAVLKAGAAYLPLEPSYPPARLASIIEDAGVPLVIGSPEHLAGLETAAAPVAAEDGGDGPANDPQVDLTPASLAYVIYTSGSTGRPKGAMNSHGAIANRILWMHEQYGLDERDRVLQKTPFSFDVSVWEFFWPLMAGATLVEARPDAHGDPDYLAGIIDRHQVTTLHFVPSMLATFLDAERAKRCRSLRQVFCSGEALPAELRNRFLDLFEAALHNLYGPTEAAVDVTFHACHDDAGRSPVPIGKPIANCLIHILDPHLEPVPVGVPGELYIGGIGLARGYRHQPALTAERFVPTPHVPVAEARGERLYRSGDRARYLADGSIEFLGRLDFQVKLRGFRIELDEIETLLSGCPEVESATVTVVDAGSPRERLAAFAVPDRRRAAVARRTLALQAADRLSAADSHTLPNGMLVAGLNDAETRFLYDEVFGGPGYLQGDISLHEGMCIFDVGANIGMTALFWAHCLERCSLHVFEPIPPIFEKLRLNCELYGIDAVLHQEGLAATPGEARFTYYPHDSVISGRYADAQQDGEVVKRYLEQRLAQHATDAANLDAIVAQSLESQTFDCSLTSVSSVMRRYGVAAIDLLKIDVEKSEMDVLSGIEQADWPKIGQIVMEVHDIEGRLAQVQDLLRCHDFTWQVVQDRSLADTPLYNLFARRRDWRGAGSAISTPAAIRPAWRGPAMLASAWRSQLAERLPEYMVPGQITLLDAWPRTTSGKIDRKRLPALLEQRAAGAALVAPTSDTEKRVQAVFQELLGHAPIGVTANFFEIGGHSLLAVPLVAKLSAIAGRAIPLAAVFRHNTIAALARLMDAGPETLVPDALVPLRTGGDAPPLFLVHAAAGNIFCYGALANELGDARPLYAFQAQGMEGEAEPRATVAAMAEAYCAALSQAYPAGPLYLGGWSLGGVVAFEMARLLAAAGREVLGLLLIDTYLKPVSRRRTGDQDYLLRSFAAELGILVEERETKGRTRDQVLELIREKGRAISDQVDAVGLDRLTNLYRVFEANTRALIAYRPEAHRLPAVMYQARTQPEKIIGQWAKLTGSDFRVTRIESDHFNMLRPPFVQRLAASMRQYLGDSSAAAQNTPAHSVSQ